MISCEHLSFSYGSKPILHNLSFHIPPGSFVGILGPNGSGKTTLLRLLTKRLTPSSGTIQIGDQSIEQLDHKTLAKIVSVLPQTNTTAFDYTVEEIIRMGRLPHRNGFWQQLTEEDERVVLQSMTQTDCVHLRHVPLSRLSGGERQRAFLASALAQDTPILLLDEPTNHLDVSQTGALFAYLKSIQQSSGRTIITIMHDLNIASQFCTHILLLQDGHMAQFGSPYDVMQQTPIEETYGVQVDSFEHHQKPMRLIHFAYNDEVTHTLQPPWLIVQEGNRSVIHFSYPLRLYMLSRDYDRPFCWQSSPYSLMDVAVDSIFSGEEPQFSLIEHEDKVLLFLHHTLSDSDAILLEQTLRQQFYGDKQISLFYSQQGSSWGQNIEARLIQSLKKRAMEL
ncbi:MAG: ABC transporter ATP-binding protein [Bacilli bacterium]